MGIESDAWGEPAPGLAMHVTAPNGTNLGHNPLGASFKRRKDSEHVFSVVGTALEAAEDDYLLSIVRRTASRTVPAPNLFCPGLRRP